MWSGEGKGSDGPDLTESLRIAQESSQVFCGYDIGKDIASVLRGILGSNKRCFIVSDISAKEKRTTLSSSAPQCAVPVVRLKLTFVGNREGLGTCSASYAPDAPCFRVGLYLLVALSRHSSGRRFLLLVVPLLAKNPLPIF